MTAPLPPGQLLAVHLLYAAPRVAGQPCEHHPAAAQQQIVSQRKRPGFRMNGAAAAGADDSHGSSRVYPMQQLLPACPPTPVGSTRDERACLDGVFRRRAGCSEEQEGQQRAQRSFALCHGSERGGSPRRTARPKVEGQVLVRTSRCH